MDFIEEKKKLLMLEIANLELDAKIGKDRHFIAAQKKHRIHFYLGIATVILTAIASSLALREVFDAEKIFTFKSEHFVIKLLQCLHIFEINNWKNFHSALIAFLTLLTSIFTAILSFWGLEKEVAQHRLIGNSYIEIARKANHCMFQLALETDEQGIAKVEREFEELLKKYLEINKESENCPANEKDAKKAFEYNKASRKLIKEQMKERKKIWLSSLNNQNNHDI